MGLCRCERCSGWVRPFAGGDPEPMSKVQSPIEADFMRAFMHSGAWSVEGDRLMAAPFWLEPQVRVGPFFADFVMGRAGFKRNVTVAVELDGHEFHAKTPEQVEGDRKRDRAFIRLGVVVMRFTGREVVRDARGCVEEVEQLLTFWLERGTIGRG